MTNPIDVLEELYRDHLAIEEQIARSREVLLSTALALASDCRAESSEALALRSKLYWITPYIPTELLGEIFGVKAKRVFTVISPKCVEVICAQGGKPFKLWAESRTELAAISGGEHLCDGCMEANRLAKEEAERKQKAWLESEECKARTLAILQSMPYADYLKTDHWHAVRAKAREAAGNRCQLCNSNQNLNVHHRTYERLGCELPDDLTVLCKACHDSFHRTRSLMRTR